MTGYVVLCGDRPVCRGPEERLRVEVFLNRSGAERAVRRIQLANRSNGVETLGYYIEQCTVETGWRYPSTPNAGHP